MKVAVIGQSNTLARSLSDAGATSISFKNSLAFDLHIFEHIIVTAFDPNGKRKIIDNKYEKKLLKRIRNKNVTYVSSLRCSDINTPIRHRFYVKNKLKNENLFLNGCLNSRVLRIPNLISVVDGNFYHQLSGHIKRNEIVFNLSEKSSFNILPPESLNNVVKDFGSTVGGIENIMATNSLTVREIAEYLKLKFQINNLSFGDKIEESILDQKYHQTKIDLPKTEILKRIEEELKK